MVKCGKVGGDKRKERITPIFGFDKSLINLHCKITMCSSLKIWNLQDKISLSNWAEKFVFLLVIWSSLLTEIKIPHTNYGIHNVLIPFFALSLIALRAKIAKNVFLYHKKIIVLLVLFYVWMWISAFLSEYQETAIKYSIRCIYYPIIFGTFLMITFKNKNATNYHKLIFYFLLFVSVFGIVEKIYPQIWNLKALQLLRGSFPPVDTHRIASFLFNPNPFGFLMSFGIFLGLVLYANDGNKTLSRYWFYLGSISFSTTAILSGSRNAWFVLIVGVLFVGLYRVIKIKYIITVLVASLGLLFIIVLLSKGSMDFFAIMNSRFIETFQNGLGERVLLWKQAIIEFYQHPIFGIGMEVFSKHIGTQVLGGNYHTHNIILNILVELGIVGFAIVLLFIVTLLERVNISNPIVAIPLALLFVSQMFDYFFFNAPFMTIFLFFLAFACNSKVNDNVNQFLS